MNDHDAKLLEQMLFNPKFSRNRYFEQFEDPDWKRISRTAKMLRSLHRDIQQPGVRSWSEPGDNGMMQVHLHAPHLGSLRTIQLNPIEWKLLQHPGWEQLSLHKGASKPN